MIRKDDLTAAALAEYWFYVSDQNGRLGFGHNQQRLDATARILQAVALAEPDADHLARWTSERNRAASRAEIAAALAACELSGIPSASLLVDGDPSKLPKNEPIRLTSNEIIAAGGVGAAIKAQAARVPAVEIAKMEQGRAQTRRERRAKTKGE